MHIYEVVTRTRSVLLRIDVGIVAIDENVGTSVSQRYGKQIGGPIGAIPSSPGLLRGTI